MTMPLPPGDLPSYDQPLVVNAAAGLSETLTLGPNATLGPERREITLEVSAIICRQPWFRPTLDQLMTFLSLGDDWNGYGERAVHESAVKRAVAVLDAICPEGPEPCLVPTSEGGVQIEWAAAGFEIEVEIPPAGPAQILIIEPSGDETEKSADSHSVDVWELLRNRIAQMKKNTV